MENLAFFANNVFYKNFVVNQTFTISKLSYAKTLIQMYRFTPITLFWWCYHFSVKNAFFAKSFNFHSQPSVIHLYQYRDLEL